MATITRVGLDFRAPVHFGRRGVGLNETTVILPADSLFSALCTTLAALEGGERVTELLGRFPLFAQAEGPPVPPFRITSLMPTANGIDLLPMPLLHPKLARDSIATRKETKSIAWVSRAIFEKLIAGHDFAEDDDAVDRQSGQEHRPYTVQGGDVSVTRKEQERLGGKMAVLWEVATRPRVAVDRRTSASAAFSSGSVFFADSGRVHTGLYTLIRREPVDSDLTTLLESTFRALGDDGLGGERAYGLGHFQPEFSTVTDIAGAPHGEYFTTLAPYLPQPQEYGVFSGAVRYSIALRRGWLSMPGYANLRRPTIRMVDTGAVLRMPESGSVAGSLADATPTIAQNALAIRRYGIAWPVPVSAAAIMGK